MLLLLVLWRSRAAATTTNPGQGQLTSVKSSLLSLFRLFSFRQGNARQRLCLKDRRLRALPTAPISICGTSNFQSLRCYLLCPRILFFARLPSPHQSFKFIGGGNIVNLCSPFRALADETSEDYRNRKTDSIRDEERQGRVAPIVRRRRSRLFGRRRRRRGSLRSRSHQCRA
jgi:hypothetical protein